MFNFVTNLFTPSKPQKKGGLRDDSGNDSADDNKNNSPLTPSNQSNKNIKIFSEISDISLLKNPSLKLENCFLYFYDILLNEYSLANLSDFDVLNILIKNNKLLIFYNNDYSLVIETEISTKIQPILNKQQKSFTWLHQTNRGVGGGVGVGGGDSLYQEESINTHELISLSILFDTIEHFDQFQTIFMTVLFDQNHQINKGYEKIKQDEKNYINNAYLDQDIEMTYQEDDQKLNFYSCEKYERENTDDEFNSSGEDDDKKSDSEEEEKENHLTPKNKFYKKHNNAYDDEDDFSYTGNLQGNNTIK